VRTVRGLVVLQVAISSMKRFVGDSGNMTDGALSRYERYVAEIREDITNVVQTFGCQPILFVGSGLSKRYMNAPSWDELLARLASDCSAIDKGIGYYKQSLQTPMRIGEEFARLYQAWAWDKGHNEFPEAMFKDHVAAQSYIKYKISSIIQEYSPGSTSSLKKGKNTDEIDAFQKIKPHAIITTNYDQMLEMLFPDHTPVIGQKILKGQNFAVGELYKIHGCVSEHDSIVFTQSDYDHFEKKKKFLSAKLLTFFNEHPLIFIGYSATDPNIRSILSDIDEALPEKGGIIPNVYILDWNEKLDAESAPPRDKVISTGDDRSIRVKLIEASDFKWVFDAFASNPALNDVNPRVLRALVARSYNLVRHDIPKMTVHADFQMLTESVENSESFAKLFGIANISDYSSISAQFPFSATQLTQKLGGKGSYLVVSLLRKLKAETGIDIKATDNRYHRSEMVNKTAFHKYSKEGLELLRSLKNGEPVTIDLGISHS
jgi:SIR2-like domain